MMYGPLAAEIDKLMKCVIERPPKKDKAGIEQYDLERERIWSAIERAQADLIARAKNGEF